MTCTSTKQQDFVMDPSDPNQVDGETIQFHAGVILSALRNNIDIKSEGKNYHQVFEDDMKYDSDDEDEDYMPVEEEEEDEFE